MQIKMDNEILEGNLEIDYNRGVIYFHLSKEEDIKRLNQVTVLRICCLPRIPKPLIDLLDVTHMHGVSW